MIFGNDLPKKPIAFYDSAEPKYQERREESGARYFTVRLSLHLYFVLVARCTTELAGPRNQ